MSSIANLAYPGDNCCTFWDLDNFGGSSKTLCHFGTEVTYNMETEGFADKEASWYCGKSVWYDICRNYESDSCSEKHGQSGAGAARNNDIGYDDDMTTLRLGPYNVFKQGAVTLFSYPDCHDVSGRLYANADPSQPAEYTKDEMWEHNIHWDDADSAYVPYGYQIEFFDSAGFSGDTEVIKGKPYTNTNLQMECQNLGDLKNRAASVRITRTDDLGAALGYWDGMTSSEDLEATYYVGFDYSKSSEDQSTQQFTMTMEMSYGYKFDSGLSGTQTVSDIFAEHLAQDVENAFYNDLTVAHKMSCKATPEGGVGFW